MLIHGLTFLIMPGLLLVDGGGGGGGNGGGRPYCSNSDSLVINTTSPGRSGAETEPPPTQAQIDHARQSFCPPEVGTLLMQCVHDLDPDIGFYGVYTSYREGFLTFCTWQTGSVCDIISESDCADHRVELICDCNTPQNESAEPPTCNDAAPNENSTLSILTTPSNNVVTTMGNFSVTSPQQQNNICPHNGRQNQNNANNPMVHITVFLVCLLFSTSLKQ